ncbi:unnamed protein product, partial [Symbiodinium necroappetens]
MADDRLRVDSGTRRTILAGDPGGAGGRHWRGVSVWRGSDGCVLAEKCPFERILKDPCGAGRRRPPSPSGSPAKLLLRVPRQVACQAVLASGTEAPAKQLFGECGLNSVVDDSGTQLGGTGGRPGGDGARMLGGRGQWTELWHIPGTRNKSLEGDAGGTLAQLAKKLADGGRPWRRRRFCGTRAGPADDPDQDGGRRHSQKRLAGDPGGVAGTRKTSLLGKSGGDASGSGEDNCTADTADDSGGGRR